MATGARGSSGDPPEGGKDGKVWFREYDSESTAPDPVAENESGPYPRSAEEPVRSESSKAVEQVAPEQDDDDWSSLQISGRSSAVSSLNSEDRRIDAERIARGEPSPAISRSDSTNDPPERRPSQETVLSDVQEESAISPGSIGTRCDNGSRPLSRQSVSFVESASPTSLQRQKRTRKPESPYKTRPPPFSSRRLSGPDIPEQALFESPADIATQDWVPDPLRRRDTVRAGREQSVPVMDIAGASGSVFEYIERRDLRKTLSAPQPSLHRYDPNDGAERVPSPVFEMSRSKREAWKKKGIDPKYMYKGT